MSGVYIHIDGIVVVGYLCLNLTFYIIGSVELQVSCCLFGQQTRGDDLHFVVKTVTCLHESQVGCLGNAAAGAAACIVVIILDEHLGGGLIDRCGVAQIYGCDTYTDNHRK